MSCTHDDPVEKEENLIGLFLTGGTGDGAQDLVRAAHALRH